MKYKRTLISAFLFGAFASTAAMATDGYFSHGFGTKSQGEGGVGIALPQDGLAAASNPAGTALVDNGLDIGASWFDPNRSSTITGNGVPNANGNYDANGKTDFIIPELGYIRHLSNETAIGLAIYGNGGMNTDYSKNPYGAFGSQASAGINLSQLFISPSLAYKINPQNSFGAAINFAYQQFSAKGLSVFETSSISPTNLTNRGTDSSTGWGARLGWTGQVSPDLTLGAAWSSQINASKFNSYSGLFANGGSFDIPETYGIGLAYKVTAGFKVAADLEKIKYGSVSSVANPLSNLFAGNPLGSSNGPGFGWRDVNVTKVGASYDASHVLTLRIGYNHSSQSIPSDQTFFNILAPGVVQDHLTLGSTWKTSSGDELSISYTHGFSKTIDGVNSIPAAFGGGNANINLSENIVGVAYSLKW